MVFAVDTESGIQDIRNLLVFFMARGPFVRLQDRSTGGPRAQRRMSAVARRLGRLAWGCARRLDAQAHDRGSAHPGVAPNAGL
jgi:hypothetical protein